MAIQMNITTEGLAKFRAALETGNLETLKTAKFYGGWSGGAVSGSVVATLDIAVNKAIESNSNICRFVCQDKSDAQYTTYGGEVINADGVVIATFNNGGEPVSTKQSKAEMMLGFEIKFEDNTAASSVINMGDTTFVFDDATETAAGIIELSTEAEAKAGTDTKRAITPKVLDAVIESHDNIVHRSGAETIKGEKTFDSTIIKDGTLARNKNSKGYISIIGNTNADTGAGLWLYADEHGAYAGSFLLRAAINGVYKQLIGKQDGTLIWDGKNIVRSINGTNANTAGNVTIPLPFLPLAGGTMTNTIKTTVNLALAKTDAKGGVQICGGTSLTDGGAILGYGKDYESNVEFKGALQLQAANGKGTYDVVLFPNGRMRLGNGTRMNFQDNESQYIFIDGNGDLLLGDMEGAFLRICGKDSTDNPSGFKLRVKAADGTLRYLIGAPDGTLTWGGNAVERVVASSFGSNSFYIKYASGLIIQGGIVGSEGNTTFPIPFSNTNYRVMLNHVFSGSNSDETYAAPGQAKARTTTGFRMLCYVKSLSHVEWIAIGN